MDHRLRPEQNLTSNEYYWNQPRAVLSPQYHYVNDPGYVTYHPAFSVYPANSLPGVSGVDVRPFHAEIARLRQLLSSAQAQNAQQVSSIQQSTQHAVERAVRQARAEQASRDSAELNSLKRQLAELAQEAGQEKRQLEDQLSGLRTQRDEAQKSMLAKAGQTEILKRELSNVAITASAEQQTLREHYESALERQDAVVDDKNCVIERLQSQVSEQASHLAGWERAHSNAVSLCELYDRARRSDDNRYAALQDEFDRFKERASEAFVLCEEEIEMLEGTIAILRTDHETVELINADLDHRNDEIESALCELQVDLESVLVTASRDRQESRRAIDTLEQQFHANSIRLNAISEEKKSLVESLAKQKKVADEFDATLFAKDQEIDATNRLADESQRQLQQLRREHAVVASQNDEMRNRIRELVGNLSAMESKLADSNERVAKAEETVTLRDRQMRELQSAARAAEANANLRASEAEQQYAIELDRLETALQQQTELRSQVVHVESGYQTRIAELESRCLVSQQSATASAAEKDRLQQTVEQLGARVGELQLTVEAKSDRINLLEETIEELRSSLSRESESAAELRRDLDQRRTQLAEFADKIATQQHVITSHGRDLAESKRQLERATQESSSDSVETIRAEIENEIVATWQTRVSELEQQQLTQRERHHHAQLTQQRTIESLNQNVQQLLAQRDVYVNRIAESDQRIDELERELGNWAAYESPINEAKRLSKELSRQIATHARERDALLTRIEQLHSSDTVCRAA